MNNISIVFTELSLLLSIVKMIVINEKPVVLSIFVVSQSVSLLGNDFILSEENMVVNSFSRVKLYQMVTMI